MNETERIATLNKIEALCIKAGAQADAAILIEQELIQLQEVYYQQTEVQCND